MAKIVLKYHGKATRALSVGEGASALVSTGNEIMLDAKDAGQLLAMNGALVHRGEVDIMWEDVTPGPPKTGLPKKASVKKARSTRSSTSSTEDEPSS